MTLTLPTPAQPLKIGTRSSPLALAQAYEARDRLMAAFDLPEEAFEVVSLSTRGDRVQDRSLRELGGKGLFSKEIEDRLLSGEVDIAVHSTKDMSVEQPEGLVLGTFLPRENPFDAFISLDGKALRDLPQGATVGSSSLRRKAQLLNKRPDLNVVEFRGSVQTRLKKLEEGVADATFLAMAGLNRLGYADVPRTAVTAEEMLPAVAQGAISIEHRAADHHIAEMLAALHHVPTGQAMACERAFLAKLDGSCQTPIAGLAEVDGGTVRLRGEILRSDGSESLTDDMTGPVEDGAAMGIAMAEKLLERAGDGFFDWK
ncbi:hydroxymethylbilane synthase [Celeribacter halophilus]|jgi:hydroxymethylbilane synthase|uniref:Porphobilinogen deaminase n=1 Tax=Celeribacter halophilus TaxID=576117 RepID=A0A1I3VH32_9RHOB|nr:hydroxymethylbilane synthase [Celeribacter halophilus]PZX09483.1 hydroxymethylbilane synthase [Celeribacter halophilus]SFJ94678.1 hydroxymethylbilane synthase [Celeribacter halophilus]